MEQFSSAEVRSASYGLKPLGIRAEAVEFGGGEFQVAMMAGAPPPPPLTAGSSFTALLELPPNQAMKLLHSASAGAGESPSGNAPSGHRDNHNHRYNPDGDDHHHAALMMNCTAAAAPAFPSDASLIERAAKFSVFAASGCEWKDSPAGSPMGSNSGSVAGLKVKPEPADSGSNPNSTAKASDPMAAAASPDEKCSKRKERDRKGKGSTKKNKSSGNENEDGKELPYVHVRARRGQATDSHSLAERARREKINARMKLLQELVPGCNKISGTALVLDEIINHVQSLQRQVEYLSMRLAAVNPRIDFNIDSFLAANGSLMESNFSSTVVPPSQWPEYQTSGERSQWQLGALTQPIWAREEEHCNFITPESSLLSYDSSGNSASLHSSHLKMEL